MARPETTGRKAGPSVEKAGYTIAEFCVAHRISESFYFKIRNLGLGPKETRVLDKVLVTNENAADWRQARTIETATET